MSGSGPSDSYLSLRGVAPEDYAGYRLPAYLADVLPADPRARILDIGCGLGQTLRELLRRGYVNASGIDVSGEAVDHCRRNGLAVEKIRDLEEFCRSRPAPQFDLVIMSHVLEHIEKPAIVGTLRAVRECLLADGGALLAAVPNAQSSTGCYWAYEDFTHTTLFTAGSLLYVLRAAGFARIDLLDIAGTAGSGAAARLVKRLLLGIYAARTAFWNLATSSAFHRPSPAVFTYEIKALARKT